MLNYTKTVLINDLNSIVAYVKGAKPASNPAGSTVTTGNGRIIKGGVDTVNIANAKLTAVPTTKFVVKGSDELWNDENHYIKFLSKTPYVAAKPAAALVNIPASDSDTAIYRLSFYIRLRNNNSSMYSNNWTYKGKPFVVEFKGSTTAEDLVKQINKQLTFEYGNKLIKATTVAPTAPSGATAYAYKNGIKSNASAVTATSGKAVYFVATDQWQMFMNQDSEIGVKAEKLNESFTGYSATTGIDGYVWEDTNTVTVGVDNGNEAFGDFAHIVKDLRLPTGANLRWEGIATGDTFGGEVNDDRPVVTGKYTQYTLQYDAERGIGQQTVLGGLGTTRTTHVFYVESAAVATFEKALIAAGVLTSSDNAIDTDDTIPAKKTASTALKSENGSIKNA